MATETLERKTIKDGMTVVCVRFRNPQPRGAENDQQKAVESEIEQAAGQLHQGGDFVYGSPTVQINFWAKTEKEADAIERRVMAVSSVVGVERRKYSIKREMKMTANEAPKDGQVTHVLHIRHSREGNFGDHGRQRQTEDSILKQAGVSRGVKTSKFKIIGFFSGEPGISHWPNYWDIVIAGSEAECMRLVDRILESVNQEILHIEIQEMPMNATTNKFAPWFVGHQPQPIQILYDAPSGPAAAAERRLGPVVSC